MLNGWNSPILLGARDVKKERSWQCNEVWTSAARVEKRHGRRPPGNLSVR